MSSTVPMTAWQSGRFRAGRAGSRKLLFGYMYEDAEIELRAFQPNGRIFCIASAGCTAMKLAAHHAVVAVDINPVQLAYVQTASQRRLPFSVAARNAFSILRARSGLSQDGADEGYEHSSISTIRRNKSSIGGAIWIRGDFVPLFLFYSRASCFVQFIPLHFLMCLPPNFGTVLRARMERCFALHPNRRNPYAYALLLGEMRSALDAPAATTNSTSNAPMRPIFSNASRPRASLDFLFQTFWMEPTRRTSGDYSLRCNTLLHLGQR